MNTARPDYGVDAPGVMRNFFLVGVACLLLAVLVPTLRVGAVAIESRSFIWPGVSFIGAGLLFLLYVKVGKFRHRDFMLGMHAWRGDERVLDVGCGRGLLLVGAAKRIAQLHGTGHATGIDIWSNTDMAANSAVATERNLELEGVRPLCTLVSKAAQEMPFGDGSFDLVVSNLCLHNIYDRGARQRALEQIARVLRPGGVAIISDYKLTREYAQKLRELGLSVTKRRGSVITTFPPLTVVIARKPEQPR
ncbi:MAG TPA: class I SAM-dependent methyltransferase [Steroidobacteraceae bacterium]|jgi:SAM-dependent methyltransferase|nr:class I SAM-dependent methyltransferase [Steroidobacteraceae bacterium]